MRESGSLFVRTFRTINKWIRMLNGKSILHVTQDIGKVYSKKEVNGYYNNLTEKVLNPAALLDETGLVYNVTSDGKKVYFSIAIFQYGLGAYDLFILTGCPEYKEDFMRTVEWAWKNQEQNGAWDTFSIVGTRKPYSSMAQGEGASLLVRAYKETGDEKYLKAAKQAVDFMCIPIAGGGCTQYLDDKLWFKEYIEKPVVLNGWIFSIWGLYDYYKASNVEDYNKILTKAIQTLEQELETFDCNYWSKYDMENTVASPFYHRLHIAQLKVMHELFGCGIFLEYAKKWEKYQKNRLNCCKAFIIKAYQKITETKTERIIIIR
ncbi:D-glucuronyl C5-epimerase family protein [Sporomusa sp. KB1]|uniref:D-glucuronyl C5-epimerase family protein n=1 Tax=Sporomusa sp. KB1 TaxID=943346 RepID=UPI0011A01B69|nr:D-glucuronyl C5-epimerase family protein [Sporomusa sp. KB1]